ncbi:MAG: DNA translocase FtsK 4TM domain-containing protein [Planctomycetota bacterium]
MNRHLQLALSVVLALGGFTLLLCLVAFKATQVGTATPAEAHPFGMFGAELSRMLLRGYGLAALLIPLLAIGWAVALWRDRDVSNPSRRIAGALILLPAVSGLLHLLPLGIGDGLLLRWDQSNLEGLGGAVGRLLCGPSNSYANMAHDGGYLRVWLDTSGALVVLLFAVFVAMWLMDLGIWAWMRRIWRLLAARRDDEAVGASSGAHHSGVYVASPTSNVAENKARATTSLRELRKRLSDGGELPGPAEADEILAAIRRQREALDASPNAAAMASAPPALPAAPAQPRVASIHLDETEAIVRQPAAPPIDVRSSAETKITATDPEPEPAPTPVAPPPRRRSAAAAAVLSSANPAYSLPSVSLLQAAKDRSNVQHELEKQQTAKAIEDAFGAFDVGVSVVGATRGPTVTQYELRLLDQAMRVNKVEGFEQDLALKLGTEGIRIVAPLPNRTTIGVEVPNKTKDPVVMRDLVEEIDPNVMALPVVLGRDVIGNPLIMDLAKAPHLLVAGSTGMGKSVCMNAMICSILLFRRPDEVRFIMVDPKMVELSGYEDIPHLLTPPITDMTKAHAALEWACQTMDERYEALKKTGCRSIADFNALGEEEIRFRLAKKELRMEDMPHPSAHMPYIVVLVDEYADLMMVNKEVEKSIVRLAAKSRACGIHVILTTQRPSADVVTGLIKSNLPSRICFRVVDRSNSRVVLDSSGAENLLGKGDMLFLQPGTSLPVRGQGVFLKDAEINAIVEHARAQGTPAYDESIVKAGAIAVAGGKASGGPGSDAWKTDRKFHEAVQAMYRYDKTGADFFRRKMGIGYNKATEYVEQLEDLGFLSPAAGTVARKILKTWDEWIDLLKENGVVMAEDDDLYHPPFAT